MADRCAVALTIGGDLPAARVEEFVQIVRDQGLSVEWDGPEFAATDLTADDALHLMASEIAWGRCEDLEAFCVAHGLPFARWSGSCGGAWDAHRAVFIGDGDVRSYAASEDDDVVIDRETVAALGSYEAILTYFDAADFVVPRLLVTA